MVCISAKQSSKAVRGTCISTSTVGWRTLQRNSKGPLPWLDDANDDGEAELILWNSFPLHKEGSNAERALASWVYRLVSANSLVVDLELSRGLALSLAKEYRSKLDANEIFPDERRNQAAEALQKFVEGECNVARTDAH